MLNIIAHMMEKNTVQNQNAGHQYEHILNKR